MGIIARIIEQAGERTAVLAGGSRISFARLNAEIDAAAVRLRSEGIGPGKTVGIRAGPAENGHSYTNWVAHLAVMKLGATHVSMTGKAAIKSTLQAGKVDLVIGNFESLINVPLSVPRFEFHLDAITAGAGEKVINQEETARRLNLTSGTTNRAKFISWDAAMIERRVDQVAGMVDSGARLFPLLHLRTTAGFRYPLATWAAGGCVLLPRAPKGLERDAEALPVANLITCSPPQLKERLAALKGEWPGRNGRTIALLGGRLPAAMRDAALERACTRLLISYGSTESGSVAFGEHDVIERHPGAVGFVRPGIAVEIVGPKGEPMAPGQPGLIRIRSEVMVNDYEPGSAPADGGSQFRDGWFYPGDVGRLDEDGLLIIEGRTGDMLNVGGWKVSAINLETIAGGLPGVKDICAVTMQLDEGDVLTFGIVCDDNFDVKDFSDNLRSMLKGKSRFQVIRLPSIPRNAMGKVPRPLIASHLAELYVAAKKNAANA